MVRRTRWHACVPCESPIALLCHACLHTGAIGQSDKEGHSGPAPLVEAYVMKRNGIPVGQMGQPNQHFWNNPKVLATAESFLSCLLATLAALVMQWSLAEMALHRYHSGIAQARGWLYELGRVCSVWLASHMVLWVADQCHMWQTMLVVLCGRPHKSCLLRTKRC